MFQFFHMLILWKYFNIKKSPESFVFVHYNPHKHIFFIAMIIFCLFSFIFPELSYGLPFSFVCYWGFNYKEHLYTFLLACGIQLLWDKLLSQCVESFMAFTKYHQIALPMVIPIFSGTKMKLCY